MLRNALAIACFTIVTTMSVNAYAACTPTTRITPYPYPGASKVAPSNDLTQPAGKSIAAAGERLTLVGRIVDKECNPVRDARIEIWHRTPEGKHRYASKEALVSPEPVFTGAGRAYSKSDGSFQFITLFPGVTKHRTPYLNIRVSSPEMKGVFQTRLFFIDDVRNDKDRIYRRLSRKRKASVTMATVGEIATGYQSNIEIVLPQKVGRLGY